MPSKIYNEIPIKLYRGDEHWPKELRPSTSKYIQQTSFETELPRLRYTDQEGVEHPIRINQIVTVKSVELVEVEREISDKTEQIRSLKKQLKRLKKKHAKMINEPI